MIKFEVEGKGYLIRGKEISQKSYDYFKDDNALLEEHVTQYDDESVPEEVRIGIYEDCDNMTVYGAELNNSSLEVDCDGELQTIELSEENIKTLGINFKTQYVSIEDFIEEKEGSFFIAYETMDGSNEYPTEISKEKIFDPKKLSLTITNLKSVYEVQVITHLEYENEQIETNINGSGDLPEFQVIKVSKSK